MPFVSNTVIKKMLNVKQSKLSNNFRVEFNGQNINRILLRTMFVMTSKSKHKKIRVHKVQTPIHSTIHLEQPNKNSCEEVSIIAVEDSSLFQTIKDSEMKQQIIYTTEEHDEYTCHNDSYSSSRDVPMIAVDDDSVFRMGECFDSYDALKARLEYHSEHSLVQYWRRDSRTVRAALMKTARPIQPILKYYSVKYTCVHGGAKFSPKGKGQRNTMTLRLECPAHIMVRASRSGEELEVVSVCNHHNHQVSAQLYQRLPRTRRLPSQLKEEVLDFLRMGIPRKRIKNYIFCKTGKEITNKDMLNMMGLDKRMKAIPTPQRKASLNDILENFESDPDAIHRIELKSDTICEKSTNTTKVCVPRKRKKRIDPNCDMPLKVERCEETTWMKQEPVLRLQDEPGLDDNESGGVRYIYREPVANTDNAVEHASSYIDKNVIVETIETDDHTSLPIHFTIKGNQNKTWLGNGVKIKRVIALDSLANILSNEITNATVIVEEIDPNLAELETPNHVTYDQQIENTTVTESFTKYTPENQIFEMATPSENDDHGNIESTDSELIGNENKCQNCYSIENNLNTIVNSLELEKHTLSEDVERLRAERENLLSEIENIKNQCVKVITVNGGDNVKWIGKEEHVKCIFVEKNLG